MAPPSIIPGTTKAPGSCVTESFLDRQKEEILEQSMARFLGRVEKCLNKTIAEKRRRERHDEGESAAGYQSAAHEKAIRKKRVKKSEGPRFACPFAKRYPEKYGSVRTCLGPGWMDVHRVKEHLYRRHSLTGLVCVRCFEVFDNRKDLRAHHRDQPCEVCELDTEQGFITDEQEDKLRTRAKNGQSEEHKWKEMYRIIFPGADVPSPYYQDPEPEFASPQRPVASELKRASSTTSVDTNLPPLDSGAENLQSYEEMANIILTELPKIIKPWFKQWIDERFQDLHESAIHKMDEITSLTVARLFRTHRYRTSQATMGNASSAAEVIPSTTQPLQMPTASVPELPDLDSFVRKLQSDSRFTDLAHEMQNNWDQWFSNDMDSAFVYDTHVKPVASGFACDQDSAYFTLPSNAGTNAYLPNQLR